MISTKIEIKKTIQLFDLPLSLSLSVPVHLSPVSLYFFLSLPFIYDYDLILIPPIVTL